MNQLIAVLVVSVLLQTSWAQTTTHPGANGFPDAVANFNSGPTTPPPQPDLGLGNFSGLQPYDVGYLTPNLTYMAPKGTGGGSATTPQPWPTLPSNMFGGATTPPPAMPLSSQTGSSSSGVDYLRRLISTMPRFDPADIPQVLNLVQQKKAEMASKGLVMTPQDMGQVLIDFQAQKTAGAATNPASAGGYPNSGFSSHSTGGGSTSGTSPAGGTGTQTSGQFPSNMFSGLSSSGGGNTGATNPFATTGTGGQPAGQTGAGSYGAQTGASHPGANSYGTVPGAGSYGAQPGGSQTGTNSYGTLPGAGSYGTQPGAGSPSMGGGGGSGSGMTSSPSWEALAAREALLKRGNSNYIVPPTYNPDVSGILATSGKGSMTIVRPTPSPALVMQQLQQRLQLQQQQQRQRLLQQRQQQLRLQQQQQWQRQRLMSGMGRPAVTSPYSMLQNLRTAAGRQQLPNMINTGGGTNPATATNPLAALLQPQNSAGNNPLAALLQSQKPAASNPLAAFLQPQKPTASDPLVALLSQNSAATSPISALLQPQNSAASDPLASLFNPTGATAATSTGGLDLNNLINSVMPTSLNTGGTAMKANGQSASGSGAPLDLLSILGTGNSGGQGVDALLNSIMGGGTPALNQPSTGMTPGGNSLLNSVMGGGGSVPGAAGGMPMGGFAGLAGMGGMGNSIAGRMPPKPATPPTNPLQMMLPAIAYSSGLDGPWGVMAMASAMNGGSGGGGGIASLMKNPMFLMNMMTGGELFSF